MSFNINKNVSVWRGRKTPPTNYHVWIKDDGTQLIAVEASDGTIEWRSPQDDIVDVYATYDKDETGALTNIKLYADPEHQIPIEGEPGKIYQNITEGEPTYQFRWSGTAFLQSGASSLIIGEVPGTAFDGGRGKAVEDVVDNIPTIICGTNSGSSIPVEYSSVKTDKSQVALSEQVVNKSAGGVSVVYTYISSATTDKAGVMSAVDKQRLNSVFDGNLDLPKPVITGTWTFYKNDDSVVDRNSISPVPSESNPVLEQGYKASFSGTYKWAHEDGKKDPTQIQSGSNWTTLTQSGVNSEVYTSQHLTSNTTIKVGIQASKTGLMVDGSNVVPASGMDTSTAQVQVQFTTRRYFGPTTSATVDESMIKGLSNELGGKSSTKQGVTTNTSQYYIYAYPKSLGALTTIIQDGATPVLGAFTRSELTITNLAGLSVELYVYKSNNLGAFTNVQLQFS